MLWRSKTQHPPVLRRLLLSLPTRSTTCRVGLERSVSCSFTMLRGCNFPSEPKMQSHIETTCHNIRTRSEGNTKDIATDWQIDFWIHLVRPQSYKGQKNLETSVRINFEGEPRAMDPDPPVLGLVREAAAVVQMQSISFTCVKLASVVWFILRVPRDEMVCEDLQSCLAEVHAAEHMRETMPKPEAEHQLHPMKKKPSGIQGCCIHQCLAACASLVSHRSLPWPRDGRTLQREAKPKSIFALQRFLAKPAGFMNRSDDNTLESLGLSEILVSHAHRTGCLSVWCPILFAGDLAVLGPLQKMSALLPSTVSDTVKMKEAQRVADNFAAQSVEPNPGRNKKLPKVLGLIRQRRLAAREEVQAVMHILSLAGLDFRLSERQLRPPDLRNGEIRLTDASLGPMLWHTESGAAQWDAVLPEDLQELRLVLAPDEGGPLWAGFQWLAKRGYRISFLPDLMYLGFGSVCGFPLRPREVDQLGTRRPQVQEKLLVHALDGVLGVARHVREALGSEAASYLDAPPDVELRDNGLVEVVSRRGYVKQRLLEDHLTATLACCFELESYARHLRMAPHACASLLASGTTGESLLPTQTNLLEAVKAEWSLVVRMEGKVATADLLHQLCPYVLHQCYRELMSSLAAADFCLTAECREMVSAWYPGLSQSSNVEDVFKSCEEACRRTKAGAASMPNLSIVAMRALMQKMTNGEGQARSVVLEGSDFEGPEVKALKSKLFSPESFTGGLLERNYVIFCLR
ncbi:unnamed protein product [Symbiodinium sp. CCMP2592]|nr:unnamed protein product [Symbiodinium sp. CCMP2592]